MLCITIHKTLNINTNVSYSKYFKVNFCVCAKSLNINRYFGNNGNVWAVQLQAHCGGIFCLTATLSHSLSFLFPFSSLLPSSQLRRAFWSILSHPAIMVEYYQILGVRRDASAEDIKKAWVDPILLNEWVIPQVTRPILWLLLNHGFVLLSKILL